MNKASKNYSHWPKWQVFGINQSMEKLQTVFDYLNGKGWVPLDDVDEQLSFLGKSETHENYLITAHELYGDTQFVFRVNFDSHLGITDQIDYEFTVLQALRNSGVTPRPFYSDSTSVEALGKGVMLMEHMPGRTFKYADDWNVAATVLAAIHSQPVDGRLLIQEKPLATMYGECAGLADRFDVIRHEHLQAEYLSCLEDLQALVLEVKDLIADDSPVIIHGSFLASDFIVDEECDAAWLVDWENSMISSRYLDLGQFMIQAALCGDIGFCRTSDEKMQFIKVYCHAVDADIDVDDVLRKAMFFEQALELKAMIHNCVALTGNVVGIHR